MRNKGQILIISLWILVILTLLALGAGHRVSLLLRVSKYQRQSLKARGFALATANRAISLLRTEARDSDALNDPWADNKGLFEKVTLNDNSGEYGSVSYIEEEQVKFGVMDEERKININNAEQLLLEAILEDAAVSATDKVVLAMNIRAWRGDADIAADSESRDYQGLNYACKGSLFKVPEELLLVKGITPEIYYGIKDIITAAPTQAVNINTASQRVLLCLINSLTIDADEKEYVLPLLQDVLRQREERGYFKDPAEIEFKGLRQGNPDSDRGLFERFIAKVSFSSDFFNIRALGFAGQVGKSLSLTYKRSENKIIAWHED